MTTEGKYERLQGLAQLRRTLLLRLSEKGYEQRSERGFWPYPEAKMGPEVPFRWPVKLPLALFGQSLITILRTSPVWGSPKFAGRGFSELPRRPSENCYGCRNVKCGGRP